MHLTARAKLQSCLIFSLWGGRVKRFARPRFVAVLRIHGDDNRDVARRPAKLIIHSSKSVRPTRKDQGDCGS